MPLASTATDLLADIAPELALRWCMREASQTDPHLQKTMPATLCRALMSFLLRAPSTRDAVAAYEVLTRAVSLPLETPGACLGFSTAQESGRVAAVLTNLVTSAARDEPLIQTAPALSLYATAGPGVGDAEEYYNAKASHTSELSDKKESLDDVRSVNLAMAIDVFAVAMEKDGETAHFLKDAVTRHTTFLSTFTELLPLTISDLGPRLREALSRLYAAYIKNQTQAVTDDVRTRLANSCMRLAHEQPDSLGLFIFAITDPDMRMSVCRICLIQRFGIRDKVEKRLTLSSLSSKYLVVKAKKGRANAALAPLFAGLIMSCFECAEAIEFRSSGAKKDAEVAAKVNSLTHFMNRTVPTFGSAKHDETTLRIACMALASRRVENN